MRDQHAEEIRKLKEEHEKLVKTMIKNTGSDFDRDGTVVQTNKGAIAGSGVHVDDLNFNQSRESEVPMN